MLTFQKLKTNVGNRGIFIPGVVVYQNGKKRKTVSMEYWPAHLVKEMFDADTKKRLSTKALGRADLQ